MADGDEPDALEPPITVPDDDGDTEYEDASHAAEESTREEEEVPVKVVKIKVSTRDGLIDCFMHT